VEAAPARTRWPAVDGVILVVAMAAVMWMVEVADEVADGRLDAYGIEPRDATGSTGSCSPRSCTAGSTPDRQHDPVPRARVRDRARRHRARGGRDAHRRARRRARHVADRSRGTVHIGASGIVFGFATYLAARGAYSRSAPQIAVGLIVLAVWGTTLLRGLVPEDGISWQGICSARSAACSPRGCCTAGRSAPPPTDRRRARLMRSEQFPDRGGRDARGAGGRSASAARPPARARAGVLAPRAGRLAGHAPRPGDAGHARPGDVHGRRPRFSTGQVVGPSMLTLDGDAHKRHRAPFAGPFRLDAVRERFTGPVLEETDRLLDAMAPAGAPSCGASWPGRSPP
jgi:hypothetical protein